MAIAVVAALGLYGLGRALTWWVAAGAGVLAALAAWPESFPRIDEIAVRLVGAVIVAALALVGFNVVADQVGLGRPPILLGLVVAVVLFGLVALWYLWGAGWGWRWTAVAAAVLALGAIVGVPILVGSGEAGSKEVPKAQRVASMLDVRIVTDGQRHPVPRDVPPDPAVGGFDVRYAVGFADGDRVRWTLTDGDNATEALRVASQGDGSPTVDQRPKLREGADPVLALLVDGTAPVTDAPADLPELSGRPGEVARWQRVARDAADPDAPDPPAFALLQTTRTDRLDLWERFASPGGWVSVQTLGSLTATDAAVRLAVAAPTSQADFALAMQHRPVLLFDSAEPVPRPLSVAVLFNEGRVRLCHDQGVAETECSKDPIKDARELENGGTHLQLTLPKQRDLRRLARSELAQVADETTPAATGETAAGAPPEGTPPPGSALSDASGAPLGAGSAIYVHPVSTERDGKLLLYLDYWWYLPFNPAGVGGGAFCGAGLVIPGVTCHDHQSDWEGITVVVDRTGDEPVVTAVQYAQHSSVVRYDWKDLRRRWDTDRRLAPFVAAVADASSRPLAFVAKGTHATYPTPCRGDCHQVAEPGLGEEPHRGDLRWIGNDTGVCGKASCLLTFPTRDAGREPSLWNAFAGPWGERHCALTYYCDSGSPPAAPGSQGRYRHPTRYDGVADQRSRFHRQPFDG